MLLYFHIPFSHINILPPLFFYVSFFCWCTPFIYLFIFLSHRSLFTFIPLSSFLFPFSFISAVNLAHNSYEMWDYYIVSLMYRIVRFQSRDANCNNPIGTRGEEKVKNKQFLSSTRLNGASNLYSPTMYAHYASIEGSFFISSIKQITTPSMTNPQPIKLNLTTPFTFF